MQKELTLIQEIYFDICDLLNGSTYKELSYDNKKEFLLIQKEKLEELEYRLSNTKEVL